jgi:TonB family protein
LSGDAEAGSSGDALRCKRRFALAGCLLLALLPIAAAPPLAAWEIDDNYDFPAFLGFLAERFSSPHESLDVRGRLLLRAVDAKGRPLPFADYSVADAGRLFAAGRSFSDGSFPVYLPRDLVARKEGTLFVDLAARGASARLPLPSGGHDPVRLELPGPGPLASPLACDLVFVIDTTISMKRWLDPIRQVVDRVASNLAAANPPLALRCGLVLFRDRGEDYLVRTAPLNADLESLRAALDKAVAEGGGDIPEDLGAGLRAAVKDMAWAGEGLRLVFAFTDAVPATRPGPLGAGGARYADACAAALEAGVKVFTIGMGEVSMEGDYALRQIAQYTGAAYLSADFGPPPGPAGATGLVRGSLDSLLTRIVAGEAKAAEAGIFDARDPALILLDGVRSRMAAGLAYPEAARARGISGTTLVDLKVGPKGALLEAKVAASSGSALLDRASLDLARSVFPTDNPAEAEVELSIAVIYKLE